MRGFLSVFWIFAALVAVMLPRGGVAQGASLPEEGATIQSITVTGTSRLSPNEILRRMESKEGEAVSREKLRSDRQALFNMGRVGPKTDIKWREVEGGVALVVEVDENPVIANISVVGNSRFTQKEIIGQLNFSVGDIMTTDVVSSTRRNLRSFYENGGFKNVGIDVATFPEETQENAENLIIYVDEGERVKIDKVLINGNSHFSDLYIKFQITNSPGLFFFTNYFDKDALDDDLTIIRTLYEDTGYLDVEVRLDGVLPNEEDKSVTVVFDIEEGPRYRVTDINTEGVTYFTQEEIARATAPIDGRIYRSSRMRKATERLRRLYGDEGYIDTEIGYRLDKDPEEASVAVNFEFEESPVVYVGEVRVDMEDYDPDIELNFFDEFMDSLAPPTKESTVQKEVRLKSGEKYRLADEVRTVERLKNLGIFRKVEVQRRPTADPSVRDADIVVEEDPNAAFVGLAVGYGDLSGVYGQIRLEQPNMGGEANRLSATATVGSRQVSYRLGYFDRYLGDTDMSLDSDIYHSTTRFRAYRERVTGASTELGNPLDERLFAFLRLRLEYVRFNDIEGDPDEDFDSYFVVAVRPRLVYDQRDSVRFPTRGYLTSVGFETGVADGFLFKFLHSYDWYTKPFEKSDLVYAYSHTVGLMPYDATNIGISERFFVGGSNSLRGFRARGVGPRDDGNDDIAIGGATRITQSHELRYPFDERIVGRYFVDGAILEEGAFELGTPRVGTGVGAMLNLGVVGVEVDFGVPVLRESDDETQYFHLRIGSQF